MRIFKHLPGEPISTRFFSLLLFPLRTPLWGQTYAISLAVACGLLISLPMLFNGLFLDDYVQRIALLSGRAVNLFEFYKWGTPLLDAQLQNGVMPWWTWPGTRVQFYRPLAEWLIRLDYALWPDNFMLMHLHSLLWYGLLIGVTGYAYRALMPSLWGAGLAVMLFAIDADHGGAVAWICNRNVLISMICGMGCLMLHHRGTLAAQVGAWGLLATALFAGESALALCGYLFAYEVCLGQGSLLRRGLRLLPYALIGLAFVVGWRLGGYGSIGPGFYIDPGTTPLYFLEELVYRLPAYLSSQFLPPPPEVFTVLEMPTLRDRTQLPALFYALGVLLLGGWCLWPLLRRSPLARFFALGLLIATIPVCAVTMVGRVLWYVGFGASGLMALYLHHYRMGDLDPDLRRLQRALPFVVTVLLFHFWLSPPLYILSGYGSEFLDRQMDSQTVGLPNASASPRRLLLLASPSHFAQVTAPLIKDEALSLGRQPTRPVPSIQRLRTLVELQGRLRLMRPEADVLQLRAAAATGFANLRPLPYRFQAGETVKLDDLHVEVLELTPQGAPRELRFRFAPGALESYEVMAWQHKRFQPTRLPRIGGQQEINVE
jgi:hypothetical protein